MRCRRDTIVTLAAVASGLVVILVAALMLQGPARERWYISRLSSGDPAVREEAAERLGALGAPRAIPHLLSAFASTVEALEGGSGTGPFAAMEAFYGQKASRSTLASRLRVSATSEDRGTLTRPTRGERGRRAELTTLQNQSAALDFRIAKLAQEVLTDANYRALVMIAKESTAAALPRLIEELASKRWEIRWGAVHVLEEVGSEEAALAIQGMVEDENDHVRHAAVAALANLRGNRQADCAGALPKPARRTTVRF